MSRKLPRSFYSRLDTLQVARELIGNLVVHEVDGRRRVGRIVETEAYLGPQDLASHSAKGRTSRTEVMFGPAGHAYVYFIYGFWYCLNVVTGRAGLAHAVLLRALEPVAGIDDKTWGPGLLCRALGVDRALNAEDLCGERLWLERPRGRQSHPAITAAARIGVDYAGKWAKRPYRFFDSDSPYVSTAPARLRRLRRDPATNIGP